jgi:hypothetical protein
VQQESTAKTPWHDEERHAMKNSTFNAKGMTVTKQNYIHKEVKEQIAFRNCLLGCS